MSFHLTAEDIVIEDNHILKAQLRNEDDELVESTIDLNEHLGNNGGMHFHGAQSTPYPGSKLYCRPWMLTIFFLLDE